MSLNVPSDSIGIDQLTQPLILSGAGLYTQNCALCHGPLESSSKRGRSAAQIAAAIAAIPQMAAFASFTHEQQESLAAALSDPTTGALACNPGENFLKPQVKRLTSTQFRNSVEGALGNIFSESQFPDFGDSNPRIGLANDPDLINVNEINFTSLHLSSGTLAGTAINQSTILRACIESTTDACFGDLISSLGLKFWRRPVAAAERTELLGALSQIATAGGSRSLRVSTLLQALILSPNHLYRTEIGSGMIAGSTATIQLTDYEIASLLSFAAWDSPPDDTLLQLAAQSALKNPTTLRTQALRLAQDPRYKRAVTGFFVDVLKIEDIKSKPKDAIYNLTSAERSALYTSARMTIESSFNDTSRDFMSPFRGTQFYINRDSARFFNQSSSSYGSGFTVYNADPSQRLGALSHPAFLTSIAGQTDSGIVKRGVYTIEQILCGHLGSPPPGAAAMAPVLPDGFDPASVSSRVALQTTHSQNANCISCHSVIDPAGFGYENFNSIGVFRTTEKGSVPIDASGTLAGLTETPLVYSDSVGYINELTSSATMRQCLTKHYFRYISGQKVASAGSRCEFQSFEAKIKTRNQTLQSLLESAVELESFIQRKPDL